MNDIDFTGVRIVVGEPDSCLAEAVKHALQAQGFREMQFSASLDEITELLSLNTTDFLLTEIDFPDGDMRDLTRKVRHQETGNNPFVIIAAVADASEEENIKNILDAGFDDLILKPLSTGALNTRFTRLARYRKPFVVTSDYVGPDRRDVDRAGAPQVPLIDIPNPFKAKVEGNSGSKEFQKSVENTSKILRAQKMERFAYQINWLIERIMPSCLDDSISEEACGHLVRVSEVSRQAIHIIKETPFAAEEMTFITADKIASDIRSVPGRLKQTDFESLHKLTGLINEHILNVRSAA